MNHDPEFKRLRNEITQYLLGVGDAAAATTTGIKLPPVRPNTSIDWKLDTTALKPAPVAEGRERYLEFTQLSKVYPTPRGRWRWSRISTSRCARASSSR